MINSWPPQRRSKRVFLAFPSSVLSTEHTLLMKTLKASYFARAAGLFRIEKILIYKDKYSDNKDYRLLRLILEYISTPPYLRRKIFPILPELKHVGLVPPLQVPSHVVPQTISEGTFIEGIVEYCERGSCLIYIGEKNPRIIVTGKFKPGKRVIIKIYSIKNNIYNGQVCNPPFYWRFSVEAYPNPNLILNKYGKYLFIGTSRLGSTNIEDYINKNITNKKGLIIFIGGPKGHVWEAFDSKEVFHAIYNALPLQGNRTIRSEEAVFIVLKGIDSILE